MFKDYLIYLEGKEALIRKQLWTDRDDRAADYLSFVDFKDEVGI